METLKRIRSLAYYLAIGGILLFPLEASANVSSMYGSPAAQTVGLNDTFSLDLYLNNSDSTTLDSVLSWVSFDPSVLEVQDSNLSKPGIQIQSDPLGIYGFDFHVANSADNSTGKIDFQESFSMGATTTATGIFARISFKALALSPSTIIGLDFNPTWGMTPTTSVLRSGADILGSSTDHTDAAVGATVAVVPEPTSVLLLGTGLSSLLIFVKQKRKG